MTWTRRARVVLGVMVVAVLAVASPAAAHVLLDSAQPRGDGSVVLTFSFDHSCDDSPTSALELTVPDGSSVVEVEGPEGWTGEVAGRTVTWSGPGIGDGDLALFEVTARLSGAVGEPLLFPTEQTCENGEGYAWKDADESSERPAPRLVATAAVLDPALAPTPTPAAAGSAGGAGTTEVVVAIAVFTALAAGSAAVVTRRTGS